MTSSKWQELGLAFDPFDINNSKLYIPSSWKRLVALIKHSANAGNHFMLQGKFGTGKTSFSRYLSQQLLLENHLNVSSFQANPLMQSQQILAGLTSSKESLTLIIIDDADQLAQQELELLLKADKSYCYLFLSETHLDERIKIATKNILELPNFDKADAHLLLAKQLSSLNNCTISEYNSNMVWYKTDGSPLQLFKQASLNLAQIIGEASTANSFEQANSSRLSSIGIIFATILLVSLFIYKGVKSEDNTNLQSEASKQALLESQADKGKERNSKEENSKTIMWLKQQPLRSYSLLIFSSKSWQSCQEFIAKTPLADMYAYQNHQAAKMNCEVYWGAFADKKRAEEQVNALPHDKLLQMPKVVTIQSLIETINHSY